MTHTTPNTDANTELNTSTNTDGSGVLPASTIGVRALSIVGLGVVLAFIPSVVRGGVALPPATYLQFAVAFGAAYAAVELGFLFAASYQSIHVVVERPTRVWNLPGLIPGLLHEATHAAAARLAGGVTKELRVDHGSPSVRVDVPTEAPRPLRAFTALAPTLVGLLVLVLTWDWFMLPYPATAGVVESVARILAFTAVAYYTIPSPADIGAAVSALVSVEIDDRAQLGPSPFPFLLLTALLLAAVFLSSFL